MHKEKPGTPTITQQRSYHWKAGTSIYSILLALAFLALSGSMLNCLSKSEESSGRIISKPPEKGMVEKNSYITLRNVTQNEIEFTLHSSGPENDSQVMRIFPGELIRISEGPPVEISFRRGTKQMRRRLETGTPYSFRYDEFQDTALYQGAHSRSDAADLAPYVPTPESIIMGMLDLAQVDQHDLIFDLGCGDGRIIITAAKEYKARGVGIDIVLERIREARDNAAKTGVEHMVEFRLEDATRSDFSNATVLALYLLPESLETLRPAFESQLKPGALIVTHDYPITGWRQKLIDKIQMNDERGILHTLYLYRR